MNLFAEGAESSGGMFPPWEAHPATVHVPIAFLLGGWPSTCSLGGGGGRISLGWLRG